MRIHRLSTYTAIFMAACMYLACQKNDTPIGPEPGKGHIKETVKTSIAGRVTDDQQAPVAGAQVKVGSSQTTTDVNGNFSFSNIQADRTATLVAVEKDGFFEGLRTLVVTEDKQQEVLIQLLKKTVAGNFSGSMGGTISIPDGGGSIVFEANTVMNPANRSGYTGAVTVHAAFINPTAPNFQEILPGTLRGIDVNNNVMGLQSFGMMAVELSGANGEKLQLAGGKKATLRFPIPDGLLAEAPTTIPLWFLNDTTGLWQEEGFATKLGNEYVGQVGHFSYWNVDVSIPIVEFSATVKSQAGDALAQLKTEIQTSAGNNNIPGTGYTNDQGVASGLIPANQPLIMKVYDRCGKVLHSQSIGPFASQSNITVTTPNPTLEVVNFSGTAVDCQFKPLVSGFITITLDDNVYRTSVDKGNFSVAITRCASAPTTANVMVHDVTNNQSSPAMAVPVSGNTVAAGELSACGVLPDEYIYYQLGNDRGGVNSTADTFRTNVIEFTNHLATMVSTSPKTGGRLPNMYISFVTDPTAPFNARTFETFLQIEGHAWHTSSLGLTGEITEYGPVNGYIKGSFSGVLADTMNVGQRTTILANFKLKRKN